MVYINSSFLGQFVGDKNVGFIYTIASILTIASFFVIRKVLKKIGNYRTIILISFIELIVLAGLTFLHAPAILITFYIVSSLMQYLAYFSLDIFLEHLSANKSTGSIRGIFLTSHNMAFILGPFIAGLILTNGDFWKIYLTSSILLLPAIYIMIIHLKDFKDPEYSNLEIVYTFKRIYNHCNLYGVFASRFILQIFFSWMVVYIPIYLHQQIGFSLVEVTTIMGIALIPYVLFEGVFGWLADNVVGEKEIMTAGFIIIAGSTATMTFLTEPSFILWTAVLFTTRIGASMVEVMTETYLFKKINSEDINILGFFRILLPVSYIIGPLAASLLFFVVDFKYLWLILGAFVLYGIRYSLAIKDTR